jgi:hypothetical protein
VFDHKIPFKKIDLLNLIYFDNGTTNSLVSFSPPV